MERAEYTDQDGQRVSQAQIDLMVAQGSLVLDPESPQRGFVVRGVWRGKPVTYTHDDAPTWDDLIGPDPDL